MLKSSISNTVDVVVGKVKYVMGEIYNLYCEDSSGTVLKEDGDSSDTIVSGKVKELRVSNRVDAIDDLKMIVKGLLSGLDLGYVLTTMDDDSKVKLLSLVELYGYDGYNGAYLFGYDGVERSWGTFKAALSKELEYFNRLIAWDDVDSTRNLGELKQMVDSLGAL